MFCRYCGTQLPDDAAFCKSCGKPTKETPVTDLPAEPPVPREPDQTEVTRKNTLITLNKLIQYFSQKQEAYDGYDNVCPAINRLARGASNALVIWGSITIGGFSFVLFLVLLSFSDSPQAVQNGIFDLLMFSLFSLFPGIAMLICGILKKSHHNRMVQQCRQQYIRLSRELHEHFRNYPNCPMIPECTNPRILVKIRALIATGQANTLQEGINHLFASSNHARIAQFQELTKRNTADCNWQNGLSFFFIPPKYFK